jgi:hypothetical protein
MPTTTAPTVSRRPMHRRAIDCAGFLRDDGLWEVEARLVDTKPYTHRQPRRELAPGEPVHDISIRLAVDDAFVIREAELTMAATPFPSCLDVRAVFARLVGETIGPGWRKRVQAKIHRLETCTHAMELIGPAVTTLYQTIGPGKLPQNADPIAKQRNAKTPPFFVDGCYSWRADGPNVAELFPQFAKSPTTPVDPAGENTA